MERSNAGIIGVAIIWGAVILTSASVLEGTSYFSRMLTILGGGAAACIIILGGTRSQKKEKGSQ